MNVDNKEKVFLDTNLWIYFYSNNEPQKQAIVSSLITENFSQIVVSTQVLGEMYNVLTRKKVKSVKEIQLLISEKILNFNTVDIKTETVIKAFEIINRYKFSYWDSLIIAAALLSGCEELYSEDMHHDLLVESKLKIINPFV